MINTISDIPWDLFPSLNRIRPSLKLIIDSKIFNNKETFYSLRCMSGYLNLCGVNIEEVARAYYEILPYYRNYIACNNLESKEMRPLLS